MNKKFTVFLTVYDMQDVSLCLDGGSTGQKPTGNVPFFSMLGHKNALVLDITEEMNW